MRFIYLTFNNKVEIPKRTSKSTFFPFLLILTITGGSGQSEAVNPFRRPKSPARLISLHCRNLGSFSTLPISFSKLDNLPKSLSMDGSNPKEISSTNAVLLGALASGVNAPTWSVIKTSFAMLGLCLITMLVLAFSSHDLVIVGHVLFLVILSGVLFVLLSSFLSQTGFVSVEQQMDEMGLSAPKHIQRDDKRK
ncbi:hypothetical protein ZOSMA_2G00500 [Zostera marina]|uniref:Transmembrane protein n=1 Tax=Zostera marina TaxID=29655 RepID=A0A0K9PAP0_ZOSMR|nr:hypothetical protein ZOSMA_2G00500 [Zostera marina]